MGTYSGPLSAPNGLVYSIDASNLRSYPGSGTIIYDLVTGGIGGTLTNGPTFNTSNNGTIVLDGTNDYILCGQFEPLKTQSITLSAWVNFASLATSGDSKVIFGFTDGVNWAAGITINAASNVLRGSVSGTGSLNSSSTPLNNWNHVCLTRNQTSTVSTLYLNGVGVSSLSGSLSYNPTNRLTVGWGSGYDGGAYQRMNFGMAKIHNKALTADEVLLEYNSTKTRYYPEENYVKNGLYIDLDASKTSSYPGSGNTWYDLSGSGNHFILSGAYLQKKTGLLQLQATQQAYIGAGWGTNIFTIDMYFRGRSNFGAFNRFVSTGPGDNFELAVGSSGEIKFYPGWTSTNVKINYSKFNHLVVTRNLTNLQFYLNGVFIENGSTSATPGSTIYLGTRYTLGETTVIELGSFKVYNRILSANEVMQNYNALRPRYNPYEMAKSGLIFNSDFGEISSWSGSGTIYDISGSGVTGAAFNGPTSSYLESFVSFDGTNDYLQFNTDILDLGTSNFTVSVWFKTSSLQAQSLVANQVSNGWNGFNFGIYSGYLTPTVDWGNSLQYGALQSVSTYNDNTWREATFVFNGATVSNWKLYINGVQASAIIEGSSVSTISGSGLGNTIPLTIGYRQAGSYFSGSIGRVLIYNRALTDPEIAQNFNSIRDRYLV